MDHVLHLLHKLFDTSKFAYNCRYICKLKSQLRQYSKYSSEATGQNGSESRNELRKRPQSKVPNRERYSMANLFGPPASKKQKVKAQSEAEGFFLVGSETDEDETENQNDEFERNETEKEMTADNAFH